AGSWPTATRKPSMAIQDKYKTWLGQVLSRAVEVPGNPDPAGILVTEMLVSFWQWSKDYYRRPDGTVTSEPANVKHAVECVVAVYPAKLAVEFGPLAVKQGRTWMVEQKWSRGFINKQVDRIRRGFRWGVENELVPVAVYDALRAVKALAAGRTAAHETEPIRPVEPETVEK